MSGGATREGNSAVTVGVAYGDLDLVRYPRRAQAPAKDRRQGVGTRSGRRGTLPAIVTDLVTAPRSELIRARNLWIADSPPHLVEWIAHITGLSATSVRIMRWQTRRDRSAATSLIGGDSGHI